MPKGGEIKTIGFDRGDCPKRWKSSAVIKHIKGTPRYPTPHTPHDVGHLPLEYIPLLGEMSSLLKGTPYGDAFSSVYNKIIFGTEYSKDLIFVIMLSYCNNQR